MELATAQKQAKILVVDDDPVNVAMLEAVLTGAGYDLLSAQGGAGAIELANNEHPDLILLDVQMPGIDGFQTYETLQAEEATAHIPIIFVSAADDVESKVRALDMGAVDYITKPFDKDEVVARARCCLKRRASARNEVDELNQKIQQVREAQQRLLVSPQDIPDAKFGVNFQPVNEAGGDFYDVLAVSEDIFGYFVADVSGHDLASSFGTSAVKVLLGQYISPSYTPIETMTHLNAAMSAAMGPGMHLTACYAMLNRRNNQLQVVSAGHPPVIYLPAGGRPLTFETHGDVLGAFENVTFKPAGRQVATGDRFFIYSDGLIESTGQSLKSRTEAIRRLSEACYSSRNLPITESVQKICRDILGSETAKDDVVLLGVEV